MAFLGWAMNVGFSASGVEEAAPTDTIARSRMLHFGHHAFFLALVAGAALWM